MRCRLCVRETESGLCQYHEEARRRVNETYRIWAEAYGAMDWKTYLDRVITNDQTGQWAKEIAELLKSDLNDKRAD